MPFPGEQITSRMRFFYFLFIYIFYNLILLLFFLEESSGEVVLLKGETVLVVGASQRRGHLVVEHNSLSLHVPFQFLELKPVGVNI